MSVLHALAQVLPPPRYLTFPSVGVDVSDASLKFVKLAFTPTRKHTIRLSRWGDLPVASGAVVNGVIQAPDALVALLKEVKKQCHVNYVRLALPEERAYIFETTVPNDLSLDEIRHQLEFKLEENVPLSARDAFFDYDIVEEDAEEGVYRAVVTVYGRDTILAYQDAAHRAGLIPLSFEVEAEAAARAMVPSDSTETMLALDFGKTRTGIGIVHNAALMYTSTIDIGGDELSAVMKTHLGDLGEAEFTKLKNAHGLLGGYKTDLVQQGLTEIVDRMVAEIMARIEYWNARGVEEGERRITKILLSGGGVNLAGFPEYLEEKLSLPAERADVWQNMPHKKGAVPPIPERYAYGYSIALGLALADVTEIPL